MKELMKPQKSEKHAKTKIQHLSADQVSETVERSGLSRQEFAAQVGCGTSQLFKYQQEGLPPRMNTLVRANILKRAVDAGVVTSNAAARSKVQKLSKGRLQNQRPALDQNA
jgi:DNA-binding transcriptional regulator YiaG